MTIKNHFNLSTILSSFLIIAFIKSTISVTVYAQKKPSYSCSHNIFIAKIDVEFSEIPSKETITFRMFLSYPSKFEVKCLLNYAEYKLYCSRTLSDENDEVPPMLQLPYSFPKLENITWDYDSFLNNIYRQVYIPDETCEEENTELNWDSVGKINYLENGNCKPAKTIISNIHYYYFDIFINFSKGNIIKNLNTGSIELLQEIWIPLLPNIENKKNKESPTYEREFPFAYCSSDNKITIKNMLNFKLTCNIPIQYYNEFKGIIKIKQFFDIFFVKINDKGIKLISTFISTAQNEIITFGEGTKGIICPNIPIFIIESSKDGIIMDNFNPTTNEYIFNLQGTLTNGYYLFKNGTTIELGETYKDINFYLLIQDNLYKSLNIYKSRSIGDVLVKCKLPKGTEYDVKNEAIISCKGKKDNLAEKNNNVDIIINWELKENNNLGNIIIIWPFEYGGSVKKKNIFAYELKGLSIRQKDYGCRNNNFYFYVYLYNIGYEPKISFELPMLAPNKNAECKIFNQKTLKCNLNLNHMKISKGYKITLPKPGEIKEIYSSGNIIKFIMADYSQINNDHDYYVVAKEACGDYMMVGTFKDMGMSHEGSVGITIVLILFFILSSLGMIAYCVYRLKLRYKRGKKLTSAEETKTVPNTTQI